MALSQNGLTNVILICVGGYHRIGWKETKYDSDVVCTQKEVDLGELTSFLVHVQRYG